MSYCESNPAHPPPLRHFSEPTLSWLEAHLDKHMAFQPPRGASVDLTSAAAVRVCSSVITRHVTSRSTLLVSAIKAIYIRRFCRGISTTIPFEPSTPTFCSLDIQPFRQTPPSAHPVPKDPAVISAFPQNTLLHPMPHLKSPLNTSKNQYFRFYC